MLQVYERPNHVFSLSFSLSPLSERWTISSICFVTLAFFFFLCRIFLLISSFDLSQFEEREGRGLPFPFRPVSPLSFFLDFLDSGFGVNTFPHRERHFQTWRPFPKPFIFYPCECGICSCLCLDTRQRIEIYQSSHSRS